MRAYSAKGQREWYYPPIDRKTRYDTDWEYDTVDSRYTRHIALVLRVATIPCRIHLSGDSNYRTGNTVNIDRGQNYATEGAVARVTALVLVLYTSVRKVFAEGQVLWQSLGGNESTRTTFSVQILHKFLYQYLHCGQDIAAVPLSPRKLCEWKCTLRVCKMIFHV